MTAAAAFACASPPTGPRPVAPDADVPGLEAAAPPARAVAPPDATPTADAPPARDVDTRAVVSVATSGYQLLVRRRNADGSVAAPAPWDLRGICWSPSGRGERAPTPSTFARWADRDLALMRAAGVNTVKVYLAPDRAVLDTCLANGVLAVVTVMVRAGDDYAAQVMTLRDHPAVLMWLVGNEWNRNQLYGTCSGDACYAVVNDAARAIKRLDPAHPVATSFSPAGELPADADMRRLDGVDVWGLNVYSQPGFFGRFDGWLRLVQASGVRRPFFFSEYGADAFDNRKGAEDQAAHAAALARQTREIRAHLSAHDPALPCLGGAPFEWNDEWWKSGSAQTQDRGGFPNVGVAVDQFANEDWWGFVTADRVPRQALGALQALYTE
jgi:hypothetical protein